MSLRLKDEAIILVFPAYDPHELNQLRFIDEPVTREGFFLEMSDDQLLRLQDEVNRAISRRNGWLVSQGMDEMVCVHNADIRTCMTCAADAMAGLA